MFSSLRSAARNEASHASHASQPNTSRQPVQKPDPDNFATLTRNLARYDIRNVSGLQEGLWIEAGSIDFIAGKGMLSSIVVPSHRTREVTRSVRLRTTEQVINDSHSIVWIS